MFGDRYIECELPDDTQEIPPGLSMPLQPVADLRASVREALDAPLELPPIKNLVKAGSRVTIAFDDATVPCYAPVWSVAIEEVLRDVIEAGVSEENVTLVCANALHRKFTNDELAKLIGEDLVRRFGDRLTCHDAEDPNGMSEIGQTPSGFKVDLNSLAVDSDLVVYVNCSSTRGFSGGWKSICVGLSSYRSISYHHDPETMSMSMSRNRMHEILDEMGTLAEEKLGKTRFFKLETVLANPLEVYKFFAGSVGACRQAALEVNRSHMQNRRDLLPEKVDVVVYGVPDWSPYAAFSYTNPILTLISTGLGYLGGMIEALGKPACTVVLATPCPNRWDRQHHAPYPEVWERVLPVTKDPFAAREQFEPDFASREEYRESYRNNYAFHGSHGIMALYPLKRLRHASRVIVAGAEEPVLVSHVGFDNAPTVEDAISEARGAIGNGSTLAFVSYPMAMNRQ